MTLHQRPYVSPDSHSLVCVVSCIMNEAAVPWPWCLSTTEVMSCPACALKVQTQANGTLACSYKDQALPGWKDCSDFMMNALLNGLSALIDSLSFRYTKMDVMMMMMMMMV